MTVLILFRIVSISMIRKIDFDLAFSVAEFVRGAIAGNLFLSAAGDLDNRPILFVSPKSFCLRLENNGETRQSPIEIRTSTRFKG